MSVKHWAFSQPAKHMYHCSILPTMFIAWCKIPLTVMIKRNLGRATILCNFRCWSRSAGNHAHPDLRAAGRPIMHGPCVSVGPWHCIVRTISILRSIRPKLKNVRENGTKPHVITAVHCNDLIDHRVKLQYHAALDTDHVCPMTAAVTGLFYCW